MQLLLFAAWAVAVEAVSLYRITDDDCLEIFIDEANVAYAEGFLSSGFAIRGLHQGTCADNGFSLDEAGGSMLFNVPFAKEPLTSKRYKRSQWQAAKLRTQAFLTSLFQGSRHFSPSKSRDPSPKLTSGLRITSLSQSDLKEDHNSEQELALPLVPLPLQTKASITEHATPPATVSAKGKDNMSPSQSAESDTSVSRQASNNGSRLWNGLGLAGVTAAIAGFFWRQRTSASIRDNEGGEEGSTDPQQNANWKFTLCFLQILRCLGDRAWDFLLPVCIGSTVKQTLLPAAALDVFQTVGIVFLAPKIAIWYAGRSSKGAAYAWLTLIRQIAITSLGALFVLGMPLLQQGQVNLMLPGVFGGILALTIASISASLGNVVAKDWTAAFSKDSDELARANSMASASELAGAAAAPLCVRGLTESFGFGSAFKILVLWQLFTAFISSILALRLNRTHPKPSAAQGTEAAPDAAAPDESRFSFEQCRKLSPDVRGAIAATVLLWCTVLGGSGAGFTAWLSQRITLSTIAWWRSSMQFIGLLGASVAPALIKKVGPRKGARIAQTWQTCFVLLAAAGFFTERTILVLVAIAVSRLGLWCFDLAERQILQEAVTASQRAPLFALETSACQGAQLSILMVGLLFPAPSQFGILVALSASATASACAILNTSLRKRRLSSPTAAESGLVVEAVPV